MKKITIVYIILTFFGCIQKENSRTSLETKPQIINSEKDETLFWIDTISNNKFLKIYSKPENDWQNLTAEYGDSKSSYEIDLYTEQYKIFGIPFTNNIQWITENSFALINGCGTDCRYVTIFNVKNPEPIITRVDYYPKMAYGNFTSDNDSLYVKVDWDFGKYVKLSVVDTDSQREAKFNLPKCWNAGGGSGQIYGIIWSMDISNDHITVANKYEDGELETLESKLLWE
ncbi:hypothetical protein GZ212_15660 [Mangrovimonas sp. CR14]|uniref:hypothetical protein n=1 Tax=Mangrovimonas sp. CR14 TaxID=2706120 RepID=UPI00141EF2EC|nr:hypothetical protein [Mangrovimonas sp. CR14]NIK93597.1 hypothetical protein [Mangrovimonas sp. CR14]